MLKQRIITALVLSAVIICSLAFLPYHGFAALLLAAWAIAAWEWADLSGLSAIMRYVYAASSTALLLLLLVYCGIPDSIDTAKLLLLMQAAAAFWLLALVMVVSFPASVVVWGSKTVRAFMGYCVLLPSATALLYVLTLDNGKWYFVYTVLIVASADIGAYFTGRAWGKRKLIPKVSPGKSWAGFWGGAVSCAALAAIVAWQFSPVGFSIGLWILATAVAGLVSVLGDLFESMLKRHRGIKDSSQLLPGHGGFMDRIDSVTAAAPVFVLLLLLLKAG